MSNIPDPEACYCSKLVIEGRVWSGENTGRTFVGCPDGAMGGGCGYKRWIEDPLEGRATKIINDLMHKSMVDNTKHGIEMGKMKQKHREARGAMKKMKRLLEYQSSRLEDTSSDDEDEAEDEGEMQNVGEDEDDDSDENYNEYEDEPEREEEHFDDEDDFTD